MSKEVTVAAAMEGVLTVALIVALGVLLLMFYRLGYSAARAEASDAKQWTCSESGGVMRCGYKVECPK